MPRLPPFEPSLDHIAVCWFCRAALKFHDDHPDIRPACINMPFHYVNASGIVCFSNLDDNNLLRPRAPTTTTIHREGTILIPSDSEDNETV